ncbi:MAG: signal peptidase II [Rhodospirillales bacterium]|nr:signal peptidase II [Rhodospirillales bacterium]
METDTERASLTGKRALSIGLAVAAMAFVGDRATKWWLLEHFDMPSKGQVRLSPFFDLVMVWNKGVSFGLFGDGGAGHRWALTAISIVIVSVLFYWLQRATDRLSAAALGLIIGGATANIYDRFAYGAVADFFDFHVGRYHWPAFNVADTAITTGVALFLLQAVLDRSTSKP